jgi:diguanylate cyclase (GGDEF)-like protein
MRTEVHPLSDPVATPASTRVAILAAPGTLAAAVVKATLTERLGLPAPAVATSWEELGALLPAELLLVDAKLLAADGGAGLEKVRAELPTMAVAGLADRPDDPIADALAAAGLHDVLLSTDGQAGIALRLRCLLERPAAPAAAARPGTGTPDLLGSLDLASPGADVAELQMELDRRLMDVVVLGRVARSLTHAEDPLTDLCAAANRLLGSDVCALALPGGDDIGVLVSVVGPGAEAGEIAAEGEAWSTLAAAIADGERVFARSAAGHTVVPQELAGRLGSASILIEPIIGGGTLMGALVFGFGAPHADPDQREAAVLRALAAEAANALDRHMLLETMAGVARVDPVTGLPNLDAWNERLVEELAGARRRGETLSVILVGIDHFDAYAQSYGEDGANELLRTLAAAWRAPLRTNDVVARIGVDEFAILLPACEGDDAEKICAGLHEAAAGLATFGASVAVWDGRADAATLMAVATDVLAEARIAADAGDAGWHAA